MAGGFADPKYLGALPDKHSYTLTFTPAIPDFLPASLAGSVPIYQVFGYQSSSFKQGHHMHLLGRVLHASGQGGGLSLANAIAVPTADLECLGITCTTRARAWGQSLVGSGSA